MHNQPDNVRVPSVGIWDILHRNKYLAKLAPFIDPPDPVYITKCGRDHIPKLLDTLSTGERSLNIGAGRTRCSDTIINLDITKMPEVDVVGKGNELPFQDETFQFVLCQAVLEHVPDPIQLVGEIRRVLRPGGYVYLEVPFFQGYHPTPTYSDFQRYTASGVQYLLRDFDTLQRGVLAGPASAFTWTLREFLAILFSFNNIYLYRIFNTLFGWLTLPLKYCDHFLAYNRFALTIASGFYFLGRK